MVVLDLFSGAGGLSEGFWRNGATFIGHIEADKYACDTLSTRTAYWELKKQKKLKTYHNYLEKKIDREEFLNNVFSNKDLVINEFISNSNYGEIKNKIDKNLKEISKKVDVIIGGPPCQAYSVIGRARMKDRVVNDERNTLYKHYVKFLRDFKPKMFVFENVPGLLSASNGKYFEDLQKEIREVGYEFEFKILNSFDFGVLQNRKRVIIIGWKKELKLSYPTFEKVNLPKDTKVEKILNDLPEVEPGSKIEGKNRYKKNSNEYLIFSKIREKDFNILTQHETRPHNDNDRKIYEIAIELWNRKKKRLRYDELPERLRKHKNIETFVNRFNVVKADLEATHTMLAHIAMDGHYYIHPDINQLRSLSIREASRVQSFPDDFYFEGPRTFIFKQIGNAVPPLMAEKIGEKIKEMLC